MTDTQITLDAHALQALLSGDPDALRILAQSMLQKTLEAQLGQLGQSRDATRTLEITEVVQRHDYQLSTVC